MGVGSSVAPMATDEMFVHSKAIQIQRMFSHRTQCKGKGKATTFIQIVTTPKYRTCRSRIENMKHSQIESTIFNSFPQSVWQNLRKMRNVFTAVFLSIVFDSNTSQDFPIQFESIIINTLIGSNCISVRQPLIIIMLAHEWNQPLDSNPHRIRIGHNVPSA